MSVTDGKVSDDDIRAHLAASNPTIGMAPEQGVYIEVPDPQHHEYTTARKVTDPAELQMRAARGEEFISPERAAALGRRELIPKSDGVGAFVTGAADAATLGVLPRVIGGMKRQIQGPQAEQFYKESAALEQESAAYKAGHVAGLVAPAVATGGATGAARLAGGAAPALGGFAEALVEGALPRLPGLLGGAARGAISLGTRGAVEGALVSIGDASSKAYLHDLPFTAESAWAAGKDGALAGFGVGAALGGVGGAIGATKVGGLLQRGMSTEAKAEYAMRHMGATDEMVATLRASDEGLVGATKRWGEVLRKAEMDPSAARKLAQEAIKGADEARAAALQKLDAAPSEAASVAERFRDRVMQEIVQHNRLSPNFRDIRGPMGKAIEDVTAAASAPNPFSKLAQARDQLAVKLESARTSPPGVNPAMDARVQALDFLDDQLRQGMERAAPEAAKDWAAATLNRDLMLKLEASTENAVSRALKAQAEPVLKPRDYFTAAAIGSYNPLHAAAGLAAKQLVHEIAPMANKAMAKWALQGVMGGEASMAASKVTGAIRETVEALFKSTPAATVAAKNSKRESSVASNEAQMERIREMVSKRAEYRAKQFFKELSDSGHPELAREMEKVRNKQVEYIKQNLVQDKKSKFRENLAPAPRIKHPPPAELKSFRKILGATGPLSVLEDVRNNTASRDSMDSLRENFPAIHAALGQQLHERVIQAQANGESVPADRVAMMSLVMGKAMNNTMTPRFVSAVQASFQVEEKQEPPQPATPNPIAESMQTPLERTLV